MGTLKDLGEFVTPTSLGSFGDVITVAPNDNSDTMFPFRAIRANAAGIIVFITAAGNTQACNFLAGETRMLAGSRIKATGTTVVGIEIMK